LRLLTLALVAVFSFSARAAPAGEPVRYAIPLRDAPTRGPATARVTLIEVSDFQCPFCGRAQATLQSLAKKYGDDLRIAFKHNPLAFHANALPAAEAALAADEQQRFWEMHDLLFAHQSELTPADLERYAKELGLDLPRFQEAMASHRLRPRIALDQREADLFGARGTPTFFINGRPLRGAQPMEAFVRLIDEELREADALLARGTPREQLYETIVQKGLAKAEPLPAPGKPAAPKLTAKPVMSLGISPQRGPPDAKVTIVEFADLQCPFCARAAATLEQVLKAYPNDVRLVFKHQPLSFHDNALSAALAAEAARQQDHFWEFHDRALAHQNELSPENYERWVQEIGIDVDQFRQAIVDPYSRRVVDTDTRYGSLLEASGTPTFFINGRVLVGAVPFEQFKAIIDEEITHGTELVEKGVRPPELYQRLVTENLAHFGVPPSTKVVPPPAPDPLDEEATDEDEENTFEPFARVEHLGTSPRKGPEHAKVTVVAWLDYECPDSATTMAALRRLLTEFPDLRLVVKHMPRPSFHPQSMAAAKAVEAARQLGRFWEFTELVLGHQDELTPAKFDEWARRLRLKLPTFRRASASELTRRQIALDDAYSQIIGAIEPPAFFIDGRHVEGAVTYETFRTLIEEELAKANRLLQRGVRPADLYRRLLDENEAALTDVDRASN
jgi:protein-disulfide isomerase